MDEKNYTVDSNVRPKDLEDASKQGELESVTTSTRKHVVCFSGNVKTVIKNKM